MSDCLLIRERLADGADREDPQLASHLRACPECRAAAQAFADVDQALAQLPRMAVPPPPFAAIARQAAASARFRRRIGQARRAVPFFATGLAAAAAALLIAFVSRAPSPAPLPLAKAGQTLNGAAGPKAVRLDQGALLRVESGSAQVVANGVELGAGAVSLEVPHLPEGTRFFVHTPDAQVVVHGTRFSVARDGEATLVSVTEGLVEVRPEGRGRPALMLAAGKSARVESLASYRSQKLSAATSALDQGDLASAQGLLASLLETEPEVALSAQARSLLAWSAAAGGDRPGAIRQYREALAAVDGDALPPWADNAHAELALLLEREDPRAALESWREYVRLFPSGLHASLARSRLAESREK